MSIVSEIQRINTNIANSYTAVENKNGTLPQVQNSNNLASAIDSIQSSNIIGATAEGESLSLTNTKAMPYSDYVVKGKSEQDGEPSPSNPSEIHNVADDVNLWSLNSSYATATGSEYVLKDTAFSLSAGTYTISFKKSNSVYVQINIKTTTQSLEYYFNNTKDTETITFTEDVVKVALYIGGNQANTISNIKLQKGTVATPYSPYNQGTVTIKQRGKNKLNTQEFITAMSTNYQETKIIDEEEYICLGRNSSTTTTYIYPVNCLENTQYTLSFKYINNNCGMSLKYSDGTNSDSIITNTLTKTEVSFISAENKTITGIQVYCGGWYVNGDKLEITKLQLEERNTSN